MLNDLAVRVASAVCLGIPFILAVYAGRPYFDLVVLLASAILAWEWFRLATAPESSGSLGPMGFGFIACVVACVLIAAVGPVWLALAAVALAAAGVLAASGRNGWLAGGLPYVALPSIALLWLRHSEPDGRAIIFWLLAVVWASDIGAYFAGRLIGGPKLAPAISPNKTWAGFAGGALASASAGAGTLAILGRDAAGPLILISLAVGICAQSGDLWESWLKRRFGVKDTSGLIPGHGGVLDRVDGLMTAAVLSALIAALGRGTMLG